MDHQNKENMSNNNPLQSSLYWGWLWCQRSGEAKNQLIIIINESLDRDVETVNNQDNKYDKAFEHNFLCDRMHKLALQDIKIQQENTNLKNEIYVSHPSTMIGKFSIPSWMSLDDEVWVNDINFIK